MHHAELTHIASRYVRRARRETNEAIARLYLELSDAVAMAANCAKRHDEPGMQTWIDQAVERCVNNGFRIPSALHTNSTACAQA